MRRGTTCFKGDPQRGGGRGDLAKKNKKKTKMYNITGFYELKGVLNTVEES